MLTEVLADTGACVFAIEKDTRLFSHLNKKFKTRKNVTIIEGDATTFPWETLVQKTRPAVLMGNLPYNVSTRILFELLFYTALFRKWVFLFQQEVANRICAKANESSYGALSVFVQAMTRPENLGTLSPGDFKPPPKVYSALVGFSMKTAISSPIRDETFIRVVRAAFAHRRKMLRNNLKSLFPANPSRLEGLLSKSGIEGTRRAQSLTLEDFLRLTQTLSAPTRT
jgi:16S rRNA (adenine1518-N6/adenine1519-N6)-dimethyltransferase